MSSPSTTPAPPTPPHRWSPHTVSVVSSRTSEGRSPHIVYVVIVQFDEAHQWTIERRFSEFEDLRTALSEFMTGASLPLLPAKTFTRSLDPGFIAWRRRELDRWVQHLMQSEFAVRSVIFHHFCAVGQHMGDAEVGRYLPVELKSMADPQFGINDCHHHRVDGVMFTACEDVNVLSRIERKLTNIRLPWEAQGGVAPLGCCAGWKLTEAGDWKPNYECAASAVCFVPSPPTIYVGLDTGVVWCYSSSPDYGDYTPISNLVAHSARITKLTYAPKQRLLLSISRDKHLVVIDHHTKTIRHSIPVGHPGMAAQGGGLASLVYDADDERVFIGSYANHIYIYHLPPNQPPVLLHTLQGHTGAVRALYLNAIDRYLFSGSYDSRVGVWSIHEGSTASEVGRSRLNGMMAQGPSKQIRSIVYARALREVITGAEGGWLMVWNTFTGRLAYAWKGHTHAVSQLIWVDGTRTLISVSLDGKVKFWSMRGEAQLKKLEVEELQPLQGETVLGEGKEEGGAASVPPLSSPLALSSYSPPPPHSPPADFASDSVPDTAPLTLTSTAPPAAPEPSAPSSEDFSEVVL